MCILTYHKIDLLSSILYLMFFITIFSKLKLKDEECGLKAITKSKEIM